MDFKITCLCQIFILLKIVNLSIAAEYDFVLEDEDVFSHCTNYPDHSYIDHAFDLTNLSLKIVEKGLFVEGLITTVWDIQPMDRVHLLVKAEYWDRGSWQPTLFNLNFPDLCKVIYDEHQIWYDGWIKHVTNKKEIKDKCVTHKGTVMVLEPYVVKLRLSIGGKPPPGRYRIIFLAVAYDLENVRRATQICYQLKGRFLINK
ncbi:hypothetical protein KR074_001981 [Drosophila pseudoananassae]|nr:hypothetical protein KR074_001981 [Drosophila pseudoananassae]